MDFLDEIKDRIVWQKPLKSQEASLPTIQEIKPIPYNCEDCGKFQTENRIVDHRYRTTPYVHWCKQCKLCGLYKNPQTGAYDCNGIEYNAILRQGSLKRHK